MIKAMVIDRDPAEFRRIVEDIDLLAPGHAVHRRGGQRLLRPLLRLRGRGRRRTRSPRSTPPRPCAASSTRRGPYGEIMKASNVPPFMVIIQRINLGLYAIFGELHATGNWRRLAEELWPFVDGPPSTPMGEAIETWRRASPSPATADAGPRAPDGAGVVTAARGVLLRPLGDVVGLMPMVTSTTEEIDRTVTVPGRSRSTSSALASPADEADLRRRSPGWWPARSPARWSRCSSRRSSGRSPRPPRTRPRPRRCRRRPSRSPAT